MMKHNKGILVISVIIFVISFFLVIKDYQYVKYNIDEGTSENYIAIVEDFEISSQLLSDGNYLVKVEGKIKNVSSNETAHPLYINVNLYSRATGSEAVLRTKDITLYEGDEKILKLSKTLPESFDVIESVEAEMNSHSFTLKNIEKLSYLKVNVSAFAIVPLILSSIYIAIYFSSNKNNKSSKTYNGEHINCFNCGETCAKDQSYCSKCGHPINRK